MPEVTSSATSHSPSRTPLSRPMTAPCPVASVTRSGLLRFATRSGYPASTDRLNAVSSMRLALRSPSTAAALRSRFSATRFKWNGIRGHASRMGSRSHDVVWWPPSVRPGSDSHAHAAAASNEPWPSIRMRASRGWRGRRRNTCADSVAWPSFTSPRRSSNARATARRSSVGRSNHSNVLGSPPQPRIDNTGWARSMRCTSGSRCGRSRSRGSHSRLTVPGPSRAARPARWSAESVVMRSSVRLSTPRSPL